MELNKFSLKEIERSILVEYATKDDFDFFYGIKCESSNIYWTGHDRKPDYLNLKLWFENKLNNSKRKIFIIYFKNEKVGYIYLDILENKQIEIGGLAISENFQGKKIGTITLKKISEMVVEKYPAHIFFGWWPDINKNSIKMAKLNNFYPTNETKPYYWPLDDKIILTRKYIYKQTE